VSDRRQWKGPDFTVQVFKLTDSDTRVRSRTSPTTNVLAFLRLGQGETDSGDALFSRQETQVLRSHPSGNETESLGLGKGSRSEPGAELRLKIQLAVENRSTGFEAAGPQPDYRHQMSKCDLARDETCSHAGDLTSKETRSNRDPCWDRSWLLLATDSELPIFLFRPPSARQRRREKSGTGPSNPRPREEPRARAPRSGAQDPPKETAARVIRAGTGRSSVRPGYCVLRFVHGSDHHRESWGQARARQTRMSHFSRTQSPAGLGWETHMSRPEKW
jgi:hypothetical protein